MLDTSQENLSEFSFESQDDHMLVADLGPVASLLTGLEVSPEVIDGIRQSFSQAVPGMGSLEREFLDLPPLAGASLASTSSSNVIPPDTPIPTDLVANDGYELVAENQQSSSAAGSEVLAADQLQELRESGWEEELEEAEGNPVLDLLAKAVTEAEGSGGVDDGGTAVSQGLDESMNIEHPWKKQNSIPDIVPVLDSLTGPKWKPTLAENLLAAELPHDDEVERIRTAFLQTSSDFDLMQNALTDESARLDGRPTTPAWLTSTVRKDVVDVDDDPMQEAVISRCEQGYDHIRYEALLNQAMHGLTSMAVEPVWESSEVLSDILGKPRGSVSEGRRQQAKLVPMPPIVQPEPVMKPEDEKQHMPTMRTRSSTRKSWVLEVEERKQKMVVALRTLADTNAAAELSEKFFSDQRPLLGSPQKRRLSEKFFLPKK